MNNRIRFLAAVAATSLAGCQAMGGLMGGQVPPRPSKYSVQNEAPRYGDWLLDPNTCTAIATAQDIKITTKGRLTKTGLLPLAVSYAMPLVGQPYHTLSGIPVPIPQDGQGQRYTIYLEYSPRSVADLWSTGTFLTLTYQPLGATTVQETYLQTRGLIEAISHMKTHCR